MVNRHMIKKLNIILSSVRMKTILYLLVFFSIQFFSAGITAQKGWPQPQRNDSVCMCQPFIISWQNNVLHVIEKTDSTKVNPLSNMINTTRTEVKKMQKSIAVIDQSQHEHSGIFQYKRGAEGFKVNIKSVMIH